MSRITVHQQLQQTRYNQGTAMGGELHFNFVGQEYSVNTEVSVDPACNAVTFINKGTMVARINGVPINPPLDPTLSGESITVGGNKGELFKGRLQITVGVGDPAPLVIVIQKYYIK